MTAKTISFFFLITLLLCVCGNAQRRGVSSGTTRIDLQSERVGHESTKFLAVVGNWLIVEDNSGKKVIAVDGRSWLRGQPSGSLAEKARSIYGARNEEFIDNVKAWAYFPYAVAKDVDDFHDGEIGVWFKIVAGQLDECAGILFNLRPNGDYLTVRFNGMEDNVVLWTFVTPFLRIGYNSPKRRRRCALPAHSKTKISTAPEIETFVPDRRSPLRLIRDRRLSSRRRSPHCRRCRCGRSCSDD